MNVTGRQWAKLRNMKVPIVSVIIPTFNDEPEHIREAVESARAQTQSHTETIVVNDGSTRQPTLAYLQSLPADVILINQENTGLSGARNAGASAGIGEFLMFLDADDWIDPEFVEQGVDLLADDTVEVAQGVRKIFGDREFTFYPPDYGTLKDVIQANPYAACALVRRSRWEEVGRWRDDMRGASEDTEFWVRMLRDGGIVRVLPTARFHRRSRPESMSRTLPAGSLAKTRASIIESNRDDLEPLLRAAFERMDELAASAREHANYVKEWQRRAAPIIRLRDYGRRLLRR